MMNVWPENGLPKRTKQSANRFLADLFYDYCDCKKGQIRQIRHPTHTHTRIYRVNKVESKNLMIIPVKHSFVDTTKPS